jgi:hypothetical protein
MDLLNTELAVLSACEVWASYLLVGIWIEKSFRSSWSSNTCNSLSYSQMSIVTGLRIDLTIALIDRMKRLFARLITFDTKEK